MRKTFQNFSHYFYYYIFIDNNIIHRIKQLDNIEHKYGKTIKPKTQ